MDRVWERRQYRKPIAYAAITALLWVVLFIAGRTSGPAMAVSTSQRALGGNTFLTRNLVAPSSLTANPVGHDVQLSWPAGQNGSGYSVLGTANGNSSNCSGATFGSVGTTGSTSYTDNGRYTPQGTWFCYQVQTTYGAWNSAQNNPTAGAQIGFVTVSVQMLNAGNTSGCSGSGAQQFGQAGYLDCGDQVMLDFNQAVNTATGPTSTDTVCANNSAGAIWLGSTAASGGCNSTETVNLGKLSGGTIGNCNCRFNASYSWSNSNRTLVVTIGTRVSGNKYPTVGSAVWAFTPTTTGTAMLAASGGYHICDNNTGGGNCLPGTSSGVTFGAIEAEQANSIPASLTPSSTRAAPTATDAASPTPAAATPKPSSTPTIVIAQSSATPVPTTLAPTLQVPTATRVPPSPTPTLGSPTATLPAPTSTQTALPTATNTPTPGTASPAATGSATAKSACPSPTPTLGVPTVSPTPGPTATGVPCRRVY